MDIKSKTEAQKKQILDSAKETKKVIAQQKLDQLETEKAKVEKDKRVLKFKDEQKTKRKEIQKKVKEGKSSEISLEDVYTLGDSGKTLGVEIVPPAKEGDETKIKVDQNKVKNFKEEKTVVENITDGINNTLQNLLAFGSVKTEAFSPEFGNTEVYHATPTTHMGTNFDLFGGNTANGATIGTWGKNSQWNQKFYLYSDGTIRVAGKCIDLGWGNKSNGASLTLHNCHGGWNQQWTYDTGGRIRIKSDANWCLDNNYGGWGAKIYLWQCTGNTERWRPSNFEMRLYSRTNGVGHAWVQIAKFDNYNNVIANTTYSLWPDWDNDSSNSGSYAEAHDRSKQSGWDNRYVNHPEDLRYGYNAIQYASYPDGLGYWLKWLPGWAYDQIKDGGYLISPSWYGVIADCVSYSLTLWHNRGGKSISVTNPTAAVGLVPFALAQSIYRDYSY